MYKYVTLNGDVYVKTEPTFWTQERKLWGSVFVLALSTLACNLWKKGKA